MSGGVGSRFWPVSRKTKPKQFLPLATSRSLLRDTFERVLPFVPAERVYVVTGTKYTDLVTSELPELPIDNVLSEPVGKNTAPCIGYASEVISRIDRDAVLVILPADHFVKDSERFRQVISRACDYAHETKSILTIGIEPDRPETGYGYIRATEAVTTTSGKTALRVEAFLEKPDRETAESFVESGSYYWNAGIFVSPVGVMLDSIASFLPDMHDKLSKLARELGTSGERDALDVFYKNVESISIDYGVMEKAKDIYMIRGDYGWSDLGSWYSVHELGDKDEDGNTVQRGELLSLGSKGCYVDAEGRFVVMIDVEDLVAVCTDQAVLICRKDRTQKVKEAVEILEREHRIELL